MRKATSDYSLINKVEFLKIIRDTEARRIVQSIDFKKKSIKLNETRNDLNEILINYEYKLLLKKFLVTAIESRKITNLPIDYYHWPPSLYSFLTSTRLTKMDLESFHTNLLTKISQLKEEQKHDISMLLQR